MSDPIIIHASAFFSPDGISPDFLLISTRTYNIDTPFLQAPNSIEERYFSALTTLRRRLHVERARLNRNIHVVLDSNEAKFLIWAANFFIHREDLSIEVEVGESVFGGV